MAVIEVTCPNPACRAKLKAPADRVGKKAKCNKCHEGFRIPGPLPVADTVGEGQALSALEMDVPMAEPVAMADPIDEEGEKTEVMLPDPAPKAAPAAPVKNTADLPSADPFDFQKPAKPAFGAAKAAPAKPAAPPPVATAAPVPPPAKVKSGARPALPVGEPLPAAKADAPEPPKSRPKAKPAEPEPEPHPEPEPAPANDNPFAFDDAPPAKKSKARDEENDRPRKKRREDDEPEDEPRKKKPRDEDDEPEPPKKKGKAKAAAEEQEDPPPATDAAFAFGFTDAPEPEPPKKSKRRDDEEAEDKPRKKKKPRDDEDEEAEEKPRKKKKSAEDDDQEEDRPRYKRQEGGMGKAILLSALAALIAVSLVGAVVFVYIRNTRAEEAKKEEIRKAEEAKKAEEAPPVVTPPVPTPPVVTAPVKPKDKVDPEPKPKEKEKEKDPPSVPPRPGLELGAKLRSFVVAKEPAKFGEKSDRPAERQTNVMTSVPSVVRLFPSSMPQTLDSHVVTKTGARYSLDSYSPAGGRVSQLEFAADPQPLCDVYESDKEARFLAASGGRLTVWNIADQKKLADALDPYAGKPEHAADGLAAVFFAAQPDRLVTVSTAGAVHLFDTVNKTIVSEFVPPHGAKGAVVLGESVARGEGGTLALAVGGIVYQIKGAPGLGRSQHDLGGNVKPLALAAVGAPGRVVFAFELESAKKKTNDRVLLYLPVGAAKPTLLQWPATAGTPKSAFWVRDSEAGIVTDRGVVWFDEEENTFGPVVVTKPASPAVYAGKTYFWYAVPHPSKPAESVLVPLAVPFGDAAQFRGIGGNKPVPITRIGANGLDK